MLEPIVTALAAMSASNQLNWDDIMKCIDLL